MVLAAQLRMSTENTPFVKIMMGVRQGDPLSPTLFGLFIEVMEEYIFFLIVLRTSAAADCGGGPNLSATTTARQLTAGKSHGQTPRTSAGQQGRWPARKRPSPARYEQIPSLPTSILPCFTVSLAVCLAEPIPIINELFTSFNSIQYCAVPVVHVVLQPLHGQCAASELLYLAVSVSPTGVLGYCQLAWSTWNLWQGLGIGASSDPSTLSFSAY